MDLSKLTQKSQEALAAAQAEAVRRGHAEVDAEHLLAALLAQEGGLASRLLERAGVPAAALAEVDEGKPGARVCLRVADLPGDLGADTHGVVPVSRAEVLDRRAALAISIRNPGNGF